MLESRWGRRLGPGIAASAALLIIASTTLAAATVGARLSRDCASLPPGRPLGASPWFRLDPTLDGGRRTGQHLQVGRGRDRVLALDLAAESFATGPRAGWVVVGSDDGVRSTLSLVDARRGCRTRVAETTDVVRSAVLGDDGRTLFEHRVSRVDRRDLGIWRRTASGPARRILPPVDPDPAFGRTWLTELHWNGRRLVVASCGEVACRFREVDPLNGAVRSMSDPALGSFVAVAGDALVVRGSCRGLPCPVLRADLSSGIVTSLADVAGVAVAAADATDAVVVVMASVDGHDMHAVDVDGRPVPIDPVGAPLMPLMPELGIELPAGWIPLIEPSGPTARRFDPGTSRQLDEVRP